MPAHRRASSIGRYAPVVGEPGDITESFTSSAMTPSMRRLSTGFPGSTTINVGHTNANVEGLEDEDDGYYEADEVMYGSRGRKKRNSEKDGLVASDDSPTLSSTRRGAGAGAAWRSVDGTRYRRGSVQSRKWSLRAGLLTLLLAGGAVGGITYFVILRPEKADPAAASSDRSWWQQFELDDYVPTWLHASSSSNDSTYSTEDVYYDAAPTSQRESSWSSALDAIIDRPTASVALGRLVRPTATAMSSEKSASTFRPVEDTAAENEDDLQDDLSSSSGSKSFSVAGLGRFAENVGEEVMQMADNGTLSAYKWHATLPALVTVSTATADAGRLIVVGDIHGTHRSLVSLLHGVSYSTSRDTLVHTGDILTKSSLDDSLRTIALLRQYGARGVRGNNDQKILEWRKWMEAYGPMPLPARSSSALSGKVASMRHAAGFKAEYRPIRGGAPKIGGYNAPAPRRQKRGWLDWFTSHEQGETGSRIAEDSTTQVELDEEMAVDEQVTPTPAEIRPTTAARPATASNLDTEAAGLLAGADRSWKSRPTSSGRLASAPVDQGGDLLGPEYAYLSSDLTATERRELGLVVPEGWEWGSEHFELAKRLTTADVEYLESLPLTLWIDEIKSWVVHAGMVPWASLRKALARVSSASSSRSSRQKQLPDLLESTSGLAFEPSSALARQLADASTRTALLLEQPNTDPFTLLNMRTLSLPKGSSHAFSSVGNDWIVSSKGRKASKGSQPWWKAWEAGMQQCANKADEDEPCEEAGVIYGHWAGQGLTVQEHSVGLDSGCVYGRRLSALVVPLGASPTSSPLGDVLDREYITSDSSASYSEEPEPLSIDAEESDAATSPEYEAPISTATTKARPASRPDWHGGLDRVKVPVSGAAKLTTGKDRLDSSTTADSYEASTDEEETSYSSPSDAIAVAEDDSDATSEEDAPWWRPWKRAPPQGRPGVAPWHSAVASLDSVRASALSTESRLSDADAPVETSRGSRYLKKLHAATKQQKEDSDAEDEQDSSSPSSSLSSSKSSLRRGSFAEEQIKLAQAPDVGAWVVSVDCAGELAYQS